MTILLHIAATSLNPVNHKAKEFVEKNSYDFLGEATIGGQSSHCFKKYIYPQAHKRVNSQIRKHKWTSIKSFYSFYLSVPTKQFPFYSAAIITILRKLP